MNNQEILKLAKGFRGRSKNCIRIAKQSVEKALQYAYRDRRNKKRDMRGLWIQRINAGSREHGVRRTSDDRMLQFLLLRSPTSYAGRRHPLDQSADFWPRIKLYIDAILEQIAQSPHHKDVRDVNFMTGAMVRRWDNRTVHATAVRESPEILCHCQCSILL